MSSKYFQDVYIPRYLTKTKNKRKMKRHLNDVVLVFLVFIFGVKLGKGQNTTIQVINVGVVTDVGTTASNLSLLAINMSLSDFYSSRPESRTRLLLNFADSRDDVVGAAAAGMFCL